MFDKRFSVSLDIIRFGAALCVAIFHLVDNFAQDHVSFIAGSNLGHNAVIVFFILSGYVIYCSAQSESITPSVFVLKRFIRLHSVLIPSLVIVFLIDSFGSAFNPGIYQDRMDSSNVIMKFFITIAFLHEIQYYSFRFMTNGPLWSLSYEFWYYILFATFYFIRSIKLKIFFTIFIACIIGFKIMLLFPLWLLGVLIAKVHKSDFSPNPNFSILILVLSLFMIIFFTFSNYGMGLIDYSVKLTSENFDNNLAWSKFFISDYLISFFIFLFFIYLKPALVSPTFRFVENERISRCVKKMSDSTLTLYVLHYPVMVFIYAILAANLIDVNLGLHIFVLMLVLLICYLLSLLFESKESIFYCWLTNQYISLLRVFNKFLCQILSVLKRSVKEDV